MNFDAWGGRRFLMTVGIIIIASAFMATNYLDGDKWVEVVIYVFGIFSGANVTQRGVEAAKEIKTKREPTQLATSPQHHPAQEPGP
jgi:hypothetical protein